MEERYQSGRTLFDVSPAGPLEIQVVGTTRQGEIVREDISYASPAGGRVTAYLIHPIAAGTYAGLILMHGSSGNRGDLLSRGEDYANLGVVALLIDAPFARTPGGSLATFTAADRDQQIQLIGDLRRGVDVLVASRADPDRIGYVGYSYGAAMGGQLAGVEPRILAFVLDVGDGGVVEHYTGSDDADGPFAALPRSEQDAWLAAMEPIEPIYFVGHAAPRPLLIQAALHDQLVPRADSERLQNAASEPKDIRWYDSGHELPLVAWCEQADWLRPKLEFSDALLFPACE